MVNPKTKVLHERSYNPSWIDLFKQWVMKLPISAWIFYVIFGIGLVFIQILFYWLEGGLQNTQLLPVLLFNGFFTPFLLALIQFLDLQAELALKSMRSTLDMTEKLFSNFQYRISTMPLRGMLIAGFLMLAIVILMERLLTTPTRYTALDQLPAFEVVFQIVDKSSAFLFGVLIYHTVRQLRLVNTINSNYMRVNLFHVRPLQAFSRLTVWTAIGVIVGVYAWMIINPELLSDPIILGFAVVITIAAAVVFVWPLYGTHRLMVIEKENLLNSLDQDFEALFSKFNRSFHNDDYQTMERLNGTIASLDIQYKKIKAIPTWPWSSETGRFAMTAIFLPLILMSLQFFLGQLLD